MANIDWQCGESQQRTRARVMLEFADGDFDRPPTIYPCGGSAEEDDKIRRAVMERWQRGNIIVER